MTELDKLGKIINTDVLIIGSGVGGLFAGIRARQFVSDVLIVDKGPIGRTGQIYWSGGVMQTMLPGDDPDAWVQDLVYYQDGLCAQDITESIFRETFDRCRDFEKFGIEFIKQADGTYRRFRAGGLENVRALRASPSGAGGMKQSQGLVREAGRLGIKFLSRIFVTDILKSKGKVAGAVGFDIRSGEFYVFRAGAVIIATGECSFKGHYEDQAFITGDGMATALSAGAELQNLEFVSMRVVPARFGWAGVAHELVMGARLLNRKGESFLEKYSPALGPKIEFVYRARAMALEAKKGNAPFYLDYSSVKKHDLEFLTERHGWPALNLKKLAEAGIRPFEQRLEWMPGWGKITGIKADIECRTVVPGLFVAGRALNIDPGINILGMNIAAASVLGYRAGENAAKYASSNEKLPVDSEEVGLCKKNIYAPLGKIGLEPEQVLVEIQKIVFRYDVCLVKSYSSLQDALGRIEKIRDELVPQMGARDPHYLMELRQCQNMALIAEGMLRAALLRTESRASHYREDYPSRDNDNWLKWIVLSQKDGKLVMHTEPVPLNRYRFKPGRYYMDNFKIPD